MFFLAIPAVIVAVSAAVNHQGYGTPHQYVISLSFSLHYYSFTSVLVSVVLSEKISLLKSRRQSIFQAHSHVIAVSQTLKDSAVRITGITWECFPPYLDAGTKLLTDRNTQQFHAPD